MYLVQRSMASLQKPRSTNPTEPVEQSSMNISFSLANEDDLNMSAQLLTERIPGLSPTAAEQCLRDHKFMWSIDPLEAKGVRLVGINRAVAFCHVPGRVNPVLVHYLPYLVVARKVRLAQAA